MGWPSAHEDDQEKRDEAAFLDQETPAELKALLVAAVEPRKFERRSLAPPKIKKSRGQLAAEKRYREGQYRHSVAKMNQLELEAEIERLKAENDELRELVKMRIQALDPRSKRR